MVVPVVAATVETGTVLTEKSVALVPLIATNGVPVKFKTPPPVFSIVKVRTIDPELTAALPKSV